MEKMRIFNQKLGCSKVRFDEVKSQMKNWRDNQVEGRWAKYCDDDKALDQKEAHQDCYIMELIKAIYEHNKNCPPGEEWSIHEWYNRWITCADGRYFLTVARLISHDSRETRVFLGDTLVSRQHYRKDTALAVIRELITATIAKLISCEPGEKCSEALDKVMSSEEKRETAHKIPVAVELKGMRYETFALFLRRLEDWMDCLDSVKALAEEAAKEFGDWMGYFLYSGCTIKDFYCENQNYAPDGFYGMFRKPL